MADLSSLTSLRQLHVAAPDVTDAGLQHLEALKKLDDVELLMPRVSQEAIARLKSALPKADPTVNQDLFAMLSFFAAGRELK
jgi:hypothetical protein